jgi:predicted DsbA family dithiol-disulfide isomerase
MVLHVDVISDVICPWCYIGKRRLEKAVAALDEKHEVRVRWLPFQLNPTMPKEGISRRDYRTKKFGSWERSQELDARVAAAGKAEGIHFAFDRIERTPNTLDAHRLIWLADKEGVQDAVVEALFRAYFTDGRDIGNWQALLDVVADVGLHLRQPTGQPVLDLERLSERDFCHWCASFPLDSITSQTPGVRIRFAVRPGRPAGQRLQSGEEVAPG